MTDDPRDLVPDDVMDLLDGSLERVHPRPDSRQRLLEALTGPGKYAPFTADLCRHFDLSRPRIEALYIELHDTGRWEPGPLSGQRQMRFEAGPGAIGADTGFVWLDAGQRFPLHSHRGPEVIYVMEGALIESGQLHLPGDTIEMAAGTSHAFSAADERDLLFAVVQVGFDIIDAL